MMDVIIIGSGLLGSVTADYLVSKGKKVVVFDNKEHFAASKCALGVWKQGWETKIQDKVDISLPILDELYSVTEEEFFDLDKNSKINLKRVDCRKILKEKDYKLSGEVIKIENNTVFLKGDMKFKAKMILICAGVWTDDILFQSGYPQLGVEKHWGANMRINLNIDSHRIKTWSPYKQSLILKLNEEQFLFSDGVKVKEPKPSGDDRVKKTSERCQYHLNDIVQATVENSNIAEVREGYRPFLKKGVEIFNKHDNNLFSATGGGKNSLIVSGWVAKNTLDVLNSIS